MNAAAKKTVKNTTVAPTVTEERATDAAVFAALRRARFASAQALADATAALAAREPSRYRALSRARISQMESSVPDGGVVRAAEPRRTIAAAFGLTLDQLDAYLSGDLSLGDALAIGGRSVLSPPPPGVALVTPGPEFRTHPRWSTFVTELARRLPDLEPETLEELGRLTWATGPFELLTVDVLASVATWLQSVRKEDEQR